MKDFSFCTKISVDDQSRAVMMKGNQFPLISNSSTTEHKLQGCTLRQLAIFEHFYGQNWMYVVLSRVRTMNGLFFAVPLSEDLSKYSNVGQNEGNNGWYSSTIGPDCILRC
jgi:sulfur transfer protein SufE